MGTQASLWQDSEVADLLFPFLDFPDPRLLPFFFSSLPLLVASFLFWVLASSIFL